MLLHARDDYGVDSIVQGRNYGGDCGGQHHPLTLTDLPRRPQ